MMIAMATAAMIMYSMGKVAVLLNGVGVGVGIGVVVAKANAAE